MRFNKNLIIVFVLLYALFAILIAVNGFSHLRSGISDRLYSNSKVLDNVLIIKIDDVSISKIGRWPWNRDVFALLVNKTREAKVVGIDVSFFEESENDDKLREAINQNNNVVLAAELNEKLYKPIFDVDYGYVNVVVDPDGIVRSVNSGLDKEDLPFAFKIYEKAYGKKEFKSKKYLINFNKPNSFDSISAHEFLNNDVNVKDKIVLIGATAPDLHDYSYVPTSKGIAMSGVEIHANIIQNLILDDFLERQGKLNLLIITFLFSFIGMFLLSRLKVYNTIIISLLLIILCVFFAIFAFSKFNYIMDLFYLPITLVVFTSTGIGVNYLEEKKQTSYLTNAFGKYISKDLLKEIIERRHELKLGGEKKMITIFFSDIRGFTNISEKLKPGELVSLLNLYLTKMAQVILKNRGMVDKYIGDAIMAIWNAPLNEKDHAKLACETAIEQIKLLKIVQKNLIGRGTKIKIGIGINTGEAVVGNVGSEERFDYTAIGDNVNLASRLESLTKKYNVNIIVSENTYKLVKNEFKLRKLDKVKVKGKDKPIEIYELFVEYDERFAKQYEKALDLYLNMKFKDAKKEFEKTLKIKKDESTMLFIERCKEYTVNPPKSGWDGSFEMKDK